MQARTEAIKKTEAELRSRMSEADLRLAKQEKQKASERAKLLEQRSEQAEITKIVKQEREEAAVIKLSKMETQQKAKAELAWEARESAIMRKAKRAESLASLRSGLVQENKSKIASQQV